MLRYICEPKVGRVAQVGTLLWWRWSLKVYRIKQSKVNKAVFAIVSASRSTIHFDSAQEHVCTQQYVPIRQPYPAYSFWSPAASHTFAFVRIL
jgi:hypothetical protein